MTQKIVEPVYYYNIDHAFIHLSITLDTLVTHSYTEIVGLFTKLGNIKRVPYVIT